MCSGSKQTKISLSLAYSVRKYNSRGVNNGINQKQNKHNFSVDDRVPFQFFLMHNRNNIESWNVAGLQNYFCKYRLAFYLHWLEFGMEKNWIPHKFVVHFILFILILLWQICQQLLMHFFLSIRSPFKYRIFIVKRSGHLMGQFYGSNFYLQKFYLQKKFRSSLVNEIFLLLQRKSSQYWQILAKSMRRETKSQKRSVFIHVQCPRMLMTNCFKWMNVWNISVNKFQRICLHFSSKRILHAIQLTCCKIHIDETEFMQHQLCWSSHLALHASSESN